MTGYDTVKIRNGDELYHALNYDGGSRIDKLPPYSLKISPQMDIN
jgi:hypothetical protein